MKNYKLVGLLVLTALATGTRVQAQSATVTTNFSVSLAIPDNDPNGIANTQVINFPDLISTVLDINIGLNITGGFNGDLYAYLTDGNGISILLNRAGRSATAPFGYPDAGFNVVVDDEAANGDIHNYRVVLNPNGGVLTGDWAPDGRAVDPSLSLDTTPRTALLNVFDGFPANTSWTLFIADTSPVGVSTLNSWSMTIVGVPEPSTIALLLAGVSVLGFRWFRRKV